MIGVDIILQLGVTKLEHRPTADKDGAICGSRASV
jgi:hypothetical protein